MSFQQGPSTPRKSSGDVGALTSSLQQISLSHPEIKRISDLVHRLSQHIYDTLHEYYEEKVYQRALVAELKAILHGVDIEEEVAYQITYTTLANETIVVSTRRADVVIRRRGGDGGNETLAVLELKKVQSVTADHDAQLKMYMEHFQAPLGLLINFPPGPTKYPVNGRFLSSDHATGRSVTNPSPSKKGAGSMVELQVVVPVNLNSEQLARLSGIHLGPEPARKWEIVVTCQGPRGVLVEPDLVELLDGNTTPQTCARCNQEVAFLKEGPRHWLEGKLLLRSKTGDLRRLFSFAANVQ